ncbi:hypothetical protein ACFWF7_29795 [Nocardia sp. NPDC060256]|uniref:hypothetical protein n=1 Tax=unclassified Nocardia TaxID=2637762 RepID=UPI003654D27A
MPNDIHLLDTTALPAPGDYSVATEWVGRLAAVLAAVLLALVLVSIQKGLDVQHSSRTIVRNFHDTNSYFTERADLTAPATARRQIEQLKTVLTELNTAAAADANQLADVLPDMRSLLTAGQDDASIANQLQTIAQTLQGAAASIHRIAADANSTVTAVNDQLTAAIGLVDQLNAELGRTARKLAPIPEQGGFIPAPGGAR